MTKPGRPTNGKLVRKHVMLRKDLLAKLEADAARDDRPLSWEINKALEKGLAA